MDAIYIPLISALAGAIIGSGASIASMFLQSRIRDRRDRLHQVAELALQDWKTQIDVAKPSGRAVPPLVMTFHYYLNILDIAEKTGDITPEALRKICNDSDRLFDLIMEIDKTRRGGTPA